VVYFNHLVGLITNYDVHVELSAVCHGENCIQQENEYFYHKSGFKFKKKLVKCYILRMGAWGAETWTLWKFEQKYLEICEMWRWRRMEFSWTDRVRNKKVLHRFKTKNKTGGLHPERDITHPRNTRTGETN
jgi:hypothetical protein